jgi:hypothetical protein
MGKLRCRGHLNAVAPGDLLFVLDRFSNRRFLVDTGASFSVFPHRSTAVPSGPHLSGPDGKNIPSWGPRRMRLTFGRRRFVWPFLLAAVRFPIIGMDFLKHFRLQVDPSNGVLLDSGAATVAAAEPTTPPPSLQVTTCGLKAPTSAPVGVGSSQLTAAAAAKITSQPQQATAAAAGEQIPALLRARYAAVSAPLQPCPE